MLNLIIFGPPGAGKGTQSANLIAAYDLVHLSTGDILRAERKAGTPLGEKANEYIDKGELVPDEVVIGMVKNKVSENLKGNGFIFDGFPRTKAQGEALDRMLSDLSLSIDIVLSLEVAEEELVQRLLKRGEESGRKDDQDVATIKNRFKVYQEQTAPLLNFYQAQNKLAQVKGVGSVDDIFNALKTAIDNN